MHYNLALIGFGNVARALARLLVRKQDLLKSKHDVTFSFTGISSNQRRAASQIHLPFARRSGVSAPNR